MDGSHNHPTASRRGLPRPAVCFPRRSLHFFFFFLFFLLLLAFPRPLRATTVTHVAYCPTLSCVGPCLHAACVDRYMCAIVCLCVCAGVWCAQAGIAAAALYHSVLRLSSRWLECHDATSGTLLRSRCCSLWRVTTAFRLVRRRSGHAQQKVTTTSFRHFLCAVPAASILFPLACWFPSLQSQACLSTSTRSHKKAHGTCRRSSKLLKRKAGCTRWCD